MYFKVYQSCLSGLYMVFVLDNITDHIIDASACHPNLTGDEVAQMLGN